MTQKKFPPLIEALRNPLVYGHPIEKIELVETHISWIILTGQYAYKIKKPVNFGFVDFSTLEKRYFYCQEELRLNRRLAPFLYLELISIGGTEIRPEINKMGPIIEYAVKMIQFDRNQELDKLVEKGALLTNYLDTLASDLADFHSRAKISDEASAYGTPESLMLPMKDNFYQIRDLVNDQKVTIQIDRLEEWTENTLKSHRKALIDRKKGGFIRECHGDLHLANMVLINNRIVVFDALEFNENLRFIDIMSDLAFLLMDLDDRGHPELANRLLNHYLTKAGDYNGLKVLRLYKVYRAMVRVKVASIRLSQTDVLPEETVRLRKSRQSYIDLAESYIKTRKNFLLLTSGFSGSGKSKLSEQISQMSGAVWIRTDVERKRISNLGFLDRSGSAIKGGIYTSDMTQRTYERIGAIAEDLLNEGFSVILDGTFLLRNQRSLMFELARRIQKPMLILNCILSDIKLRQRVLRRKKEGNDPSEADIKVVQWQKKNFEMFSKDELPHVFTINTASPFKMKNIMKEIIHRLDVIPEQIDKGRGVV